MSDKDYDEEAGAGTTCRALRGVTRAGSSAVRQGDPAPWHAAVGRRARNRDPRIQRTPGMCDDSDVP
ncbi:MAG: hypothetical protein JRH05_00885 [Deltaproteobacteria bacterium]|nr:hypothetical protein [Deltaproteobacteria bacterium]